MKRCLTYISMRMVKINTDNTKCWPGCGVIGAFVHCWGECRTVYSGRQFGIRTKHLTVQSNLYAPCIYLKDVETYVHTKSLHMDGYSSFAHNYLNSEATILIDDQILSNDLLIQCWEEQAIKLWKILSTYSQVKEAILKQLVPIKCHCRKVKGEMLKASRCTENVILVNEASS